MWSTGMMSPDWWKEAAISRKWYRDENAFADHCIQEPIPGMRINHIRIYFNGAKSDIPVLLGKTKSEEGGTASISDNGEPFELKMLENVLLSKLMEKAFLKDQSGADKYAVTKIVYENNTLAFSITDLGTNEETAVVMGIAPEGFETDVFNNINNSPVDNSKPTAPAPTGPWSCACGTQNTGNFCTACGRPRANN